ncbi:putative HTH-type transcriptional regulator [Crateriforma conspicua]|nr:putative HTH-type transcriptional regulator [Crateriforma conspicua]
MDRLLAEKSGKSGSPVLTCNADTCKHGDMAMKRKTRKQYEARAKIAKALAHPSRLLILDLLQERERCVGELTEAVEADQSTVSKHLAVLRDVGLVEVRKEGASSYYRIACDCLGGFFACMESVLRSDVRDRQSTLK